MFSILGTPYTSGDPTAPPSVLWLRDGESIVDGDRFKVKTHFYYLLLGPEKEFDRRSR